MSFDRPRQGDIARISPNDPLPAVPKPEGRWGDPYQTSDGNWTCHLRQPVAGTVRRREGLVRTLVAADLEMLRRLQDQQDELAERLRVDSVAAYLHRA